MSIQPLENKNRNIRRNQMSKQVEDMQIIGYGKDFERYAMDKKTFLKLVEESYLLYGKKYVRYEEGAKRYSMCKNSFMKLDNDAKAVYKINKMSLVNTQIFEEYLESYRL